MTSTIIVVHTPQTALPARVLEQVLPQLGCQKELIDLTLAVNSGRRKAREISDALAEGRRKLLVLFDPSYPNSLRFMSWLEYFPELKDNTVFCIELQDILAAEARKAWLFLPKELHPHDIIDYMYHAAVRQLHHDQKSNPSRR